MLIQTIFNEYIELKPYFYTMAKVKYTETLYNKYIKDVFGNKEISTLNKLAYQNFAKKLLSGIYKQTTVQEIFFDVFLILVDIYRFAIMSEYYQGHNIPSTVFVQVSIQKVK